MKQLVIFPRGQLTAEDKKKMSKLGICAIEADDPSKVVTLVPGMHVSGDMLAMCAMDAMAGRGGLNSCEHFRAIFAENLRLAIKARDAKPVS
jgi:hypothetical protein